MVSLDLGSRSGSRQVWTGRAGAIVSQIPSVPITSIGMTATPFQYNANVANADLGDTFYGCWGDDGNNYLVANDGNNWTNVAQPGLHGSNIFMSTINDAGVTYPNIASASAVSINEMPAWGGFNVAGSDSATYKSSGIVCINGVLYCSACRQASGRNLGVQLIKSSDHGVTWTPTPPSTANPYVSPMWTNAIFYPCFVTYGMNNTFNFGTWATLVAQDLADQYVYMVFPNCNPTTGPLGTNASLARCLISNIGNLSAGDWSYYISGDGTNPANWTSTYGSRGNIFTYLGLNINGFELPWIGFVPFCRRYLAMILDADSNSVNAGQGPVQLICLESPTPWGPWTFVTILTMGVNISAGATGNYHAAWQNIYPKSMQYDGGNHVVLATSGTVGSNQYTLWLWPLTISNTTGPTWNSGVGNATLSFTNRTATSITSGVTWTRSTTSHTSGKYYVEYKVVNCTGGIGGNYACNMGLVNGSYSGAYGLGGATDSVGTFAPGDGTYYFNATHSGVGTTGVVNGDYVGMAIDLDNNRLWTRLNNGPWLGSVSGGNPATNSGGFDISGISKPIYIGCGFSTSSGYICEMNFGVLGTATYKFSVPSGFGVW